MIHSEIIINQHYPGFNPVQFGYEDCAAGHFFGPAVRTHWLLHYIVSGKGIFRIDSVIYHLSPGQIFVIPPYVQTYYEADSQQPWSYIWIGFEADNLSLSELKPILHCPGTERVFVDMKSCSDMGNGKSAFLCAKIWELFSLLLDSSSKKKPGYVEQAIHKMKSEYMNGIKIEELAQELHLDRSYFCNLFRNSVGLSPQEYLTDLRLKKAAELMTIYKQSPSTAALSAGYTDIYNFSKMFRKKYGFSPREFIKRYHENHLASPSEFP